MVANPLRVFIGYDEGESLAWDVCQRSLIAHATVPVLAEAIDQDALRRAGLYWREWKMIDGQRIDASDNRPFSTDFTFTRFLVPALCQWRGVALFCDSDFLWRRDVSELFAEFDPRYAVQVVKHRHQPTETHKMRGQKQTQYARKNWSSLMLFNCGHPGNVGLTPKQANQWAGAALHGFGWLDDDEIGELDPGWNWLEGHDDPTIEPLAVHYTRGTPDMDPAYEAAAYADEWREWA